MPVESRHPTNELMQIREYNKKRPDSTIVTRIAPESDEWKYQGVFF